MRIRRSLVHALVALIGSGMLCAGVRAQTPAAVSLVQAQQIALQNHPRIASAALTAQASASVVKEVHSAYYPTVSGNLTGVGSEPLLSGR